MNETPTANDTFAVTKALERVAQAGAEYARTGESHVRARENLHAAVREAWSQGASMGKIATAAGVSKSRVAQIVRR